MTNEEYLKQIAKHVQRNSEGKGLGNYLNPGTKKVDIQFFKRKKISSYDKDQFKIFEDPDFIFSYIDHEEDYWFLNDNNPFYEDYVDDHCETITIFDEDADLDFPEHRSFNFLDKGSVSISFFLKISPVDNCGIPNFFEIKSACVPFPAPGGPKKIKIILYRRPFNFVFFNNPSYWC